MVRQSFVVVVGAPRCGTTTLYQYLLHSFPGASALGKDNYWLMDPSSGLYSAKASADKREQCWYQRQCIRENTLTIEGAAGYLYQDTALTQLSRLDGRVLALIILRDPITRLASIYRYFSNNRREIDLSFSEYVQALQAQKSISADETISDALRQGRYELWIPAWQDQLAASGKELALVSFEAFCHHGGAVAKLVSTFSGAGPTHGGPPPGVNASRDRPRGLVQARLRGLIGPHLPRAVRSRLGSSRKRSAAPSPTRDDDLIPAAIREELAAYYSPTYAFLDAIGDSNAFV